MNMTIVVRKEQSSKNMNKKVVVHWRSSEDRMGAGCCISDFVDVLAGVRPVQAADGDPALFRVFVSCSYPDQNPTGCISTVLKDR